MGLFSNILSGIGMLGGGAASGMPAKSTTNSNTTSSATGSSLLTGSGDYSSRPVFDPQTDNLRQNLIASILKNLNTDTDLTGYQNNALQQNNQSYGAADKALQSTLAARGLTYSPVAGSAQSQLNTNRIGSGIQIQNQIPLLQQQLYQQKLQQALQTFAAQPFGQSGQQSQTQSGQQQQNMNSSTNSTTVNKQPGGWLGGLLGGIGDLGTLLA